MTKSKGIGERVLEVLFGRQVLDDSSEPTANYQRRQNKLITSSSLVVSAFWVLAVIGASQKSLEVGLIVAFAILYYKIHSVGAMISDAVFDSLWERINLQSRWLDIRLQAIEGAATERRQSGQLKWDEKEA